MKMLETSIKKKIQESKNSSKGKYYMGIKQEKWYSVSLPPDPRLMACYLEMAVNDNACISMAKYMYIYS